MKKFQSVTPAYQADNQTNYSLNKLDFEIMGQLIDDGRKSLTDIASELGVSVGTVRNRLGRLQKDGVINILGLVNPNKIGFNAYAQIYIAVRPANLIESIAKQIVNFPETSFVAEIAGEFDLEVNMMCRDNNHLTSLLNDRLYKIEGIHQTKTNMYLKIYKVAQPDLKLLHPKQNVL
jgi:Lrp/AsnC family transcriptional regulator for asnA, asnC and gidA